MPIGRITHQFTFKRVYERAKTPQINYEDIIRSFITKQVLLKLCVKKARIILKPEKVFSALIRRRNVSPLISINHILYLLISYFRTRP